MADIVATHRLTHEASLKMLAAGVAKANELGCKVSLAVVDKAVLSLQEERGPDGLRAFWFERGLSVTTGSSMAVSVDRWNDVIAEAPRQGKGGSGLVGQQVRQDFRNTAYWSAHVVTKADGTASVSLR